MEIIELEVERIANLFAQARNIKIRIFFGKLGDENFPKPKATNDPRQGSCIFNKSLKRHEIHILLDRNSRACIFQTLAHELAHAWKRELEKIRELKSHDSTFWKIMDEMTFPFVAENLTEEKDRVNLLKLLNPTTNLDEEWNQISTDNKERRIIFTIDKENIDRIWKIVRKEAINGNLSSKVAVSTARKDNSKYYIAIYAREGEDVPSLVEKLQDLGLNYEFKTY